jgi:hypothetical protein
MPTTVPFHYVIPGLVFFGVVLIFLSIGLQLGKKRNSPRREFNITQESKEVYHIPEEYSSMGPDAKRRVTIQNLHLNYGETPEDIATLLDVEAAFVAEVLKGSGNHNSCGSTLHS